MSTLIEVRNLCKSYGSVRALDRVSFDVKEGSVMGFLGPNGAGKSTTLRILAGFLPGDGGSARVAGLDVSRESLAVRRQIGYLPEGVPLYSDMRVCEYLKFRSRLKGIRRRDRARQIEKSLEAADVKNVEKRMIGTLSRGFRQRVGLADALLAEPKVLILDEPTVGLDPEQVILFRNVLREVGRDRTVVLSTHILAEVEVVCSDIVIICDGRVVAQSAAAELQNVAHESRCASAEIAGPGKRIRQALSEIPDVSRVEVQDIEPARESGGSVYRTYRVFGGGRDDLSERIYSAVQKEGWMLRRLQDEKLSLEEIFLDIVGSEN